MPDRNNIVVTDEPGEAVFINGRLMQGINVTMGDADHDKMRKGYMCILCLEDWSNTDIGAFPEVCPAEWCDFPIRDHLLDEYAYQFQGFKQLGGQINADEEIGRLERQRHERQVREGLRSRGIVIPRNAKL